VPVAGAFSYFLSPAGCVTKALSAEREEAAAGEPVVLEGDEAYEVEIPPLSRPGSLVWFQREGKWIDFVVSPMVRTHLAVQNEKLLLSVKNNLPHPDDLAISFGPQLLPGANIAAGDVHTVEIPGFNSGSEFMHSAKLLISNARAQHLETWWLLAIIENGEQQLSVHTSSDGVAYQPGPYGKPNLKIDDIHSARAAWLRLEVVGCVNRDATRVRLNGVDLGPLPPTQSYFNEIKSDRYSPLYMQLPSNVIASLNPVNELVIENPGRRSIRPAGSGSNWRWTTSGTFPPALRPRFTRNRPATSSTPSCTIPPIRILSAPPGRTSGLLLSNPSQGNAYAN
jgi:hypothetical protein